MSDQRCESTRNHYRCELLTGHEADHRCGGLGWIVSDATIAEAEEMARTDRERAPLVAKAWSEVRVEMTRSLRARAAEHDRIAAMGGQSSEQMQRRLAEMGHPTYAQQAIAERALADQVEALTPPAPLDGDDREVSGKGFPPWSR